MTALLYDCPCCNYPTLPSWFDYDICYLCWWEDDGQDDDDADRVKGGPNSDYSLTEARTNFNKYLISFRPSDSRFTSHRNEKIDSIKRDIIKLLEARVDSESTRIKELVDLLDKETDIQIKKSELS
jgi:hypothetical protein